MLNPSTFGERAAISRPADLSDPAERERLTGAALKAFFRLVDAWGLREEDARGLLGGVSHARYTGLKRGVRDGARAKALSQDELTRVSLLVGIAKALRILHDRPLADRWVRLANRNQMFQGRPPVEVMIAGGIPALFDARRLLDARRGFLA